MTPTRWERVQSLLSVVLDLPPTERPSYLDQACPGNTELRHQVEHLVESYERAGDLMENAVGAAAGQLNETAAAGERIGAYQILDSIGEGGMGVVYRAVRADDQFRQQVAIKVMRIGAGASPELLTRFRAERQILANLTHPNIGRLLDGGVTENGRPYLVMEYIEGVSIECFVQEKNLPLSARLDLFRKLCEAIQYAHQNLIVHRDLKPANVLVTAEGVPKLLDFGIAKLLDPDSLLQTVAWTRPAERLMTPAYASPEQIRGGVITTATDVYGLGGLLYELLTGQRPFRTESLTAAQVEHLICDTQPERPSAVNTGSLPEPIGNDLDNIVLKAMHKEPARRYSSAAELSEDVRRYQQGFPVVARPDTWRYRSGKFVSRHKWAVAAAAAFVITITALTIGLFLQRQRARREARTAEQVSQFLISIFRVSRPEEAQGREISAREILDRGAERITKELNSDPAVESRLLYNVATVYFTMGLLDRAESMANQASEVRGKVFGPNSEEVGEVSNLLGLIHNERGRPEEALRAYQKTLEIFTRIDGRESKAVATSLNNISLVLEQLGDYAEAEKRIRECLEISARFKGSTPADLLVGKNNLQMILANEENYAASEPLLRELLETRRKLLGPNHPHTLTSMNNLAFLLQKTGRLKEAEAVARQTLELRIKVFGPVHGDVGRSLSLLAGICNELGHYEEAQKLNEQALQVTLKRAQRTLSLANVQDGLGLTALATGDLAKARELFQTAYETRLKLRNPNHPLIADSRSRLGQVDLAMKNTQQARENFEAALAIRTRVFAANPGPSLASTYFNLGQVDSAEGKPEAAEKHYQQALTILKAKFPDGHPLTATTLFHLAGVQTAQKRTAEARNSLTESLSIRRSLLPEDHPDRKKSEASLQ